MMAASLIGMHLQVKPPTGLKFFNAFQLLQSNISVRWRKSFYTSVVPARTSRNLAA